MTFFMNATTTPQLPEAATIQNAGTVRIAVAVECDQPTEWNYRAYRIFMLALRAAFARKDVSVVYEDGYFLPFQVVRLYTVLRTSHAAALEVIRATLRELALEHAASVAVYSSEDTWVTLDGYGKGRSDFAAQFLREEQRIVADFELRRIEIETSQAILLLKLKKALREAATPPETGDENAS